MASDIPILDLADRFREWSSSCAVFDLRTQLSGQTFNAIDSESPPDQEPTLEELFLEWRTTQATGTKAPHDTVAELFRMAVGDAPGATPDFGLTSLSASVAKTLDALAPKGSRT